MYMISAIREIAEMDEELQDSRIATAQYLEACNLLFEQGILSHSIVSSTVLENMKKGYEYFKEWYQELKEAST